MYMHPSGDIDIDDMKTGIPAPNAVKNFKMNPVEFEKVCVNHS
jgi:hypothetical protein